MTKFEEALIELIGEHRDAGLPWDDIISAMEMQIMAASEQSAQESE